MRRRALTILLLGAVVVMPSATASYAAAPWSAPVNVSAAANDIGAYDVAFDAHGRALATWAAYRWQSGTAHGHYVLDGWHAATRAPGAAAFAAPTSAPSFTAPPVLYGISRAVGLDERSLGWATCGERATIRARFGTSGGTFQAPMTIATARGAGFDPQPAIAANASGVVLAAWTATPGRTCARALIQFALRRPGGSRFSAPETLRGRGSSGTASVAVGQGGDLLVAWARRVGNGRTVIEARYRQAGHRWSAVQALGSGTVAGPLTTAVAQNGRAYVAWGAQDINESTGLHARFSVAVRPAGARAFRPAQTLEQVATATAFLPRLGPVLALSGTTAFVAWTGNDGAWRVRVAQSDANGGFGAPQTVSPAGSSAVLGDLAALPDGTAAITWAGLDSEYLVHDVAAAVRRRGGTFGTPETVSPGALRAPVIALDPVTDQPTTAWAERVGPVTSVATITAFVRSSTRVGAP